MKKCTKCSVEKEVIMFPKIGNICKECKNEYSKNQKRKIRETNPEKASESKRKYYLNNKEKFQKWDIENRNNPLRKENRKEYRKKNGEKLKLNQREYYLNNKEKSAQYYLNNKEKFYNKEKSAQYYLDNKEKIKKRNLLYRKNNPITTNESRRLWHKNKMENNPLYNLRCKTHNLIVSAFKRAYTKKSKKTAKNSACLLVTPCHQRGLTLLRARNLVSPTDF